jgi:IstB-like ATP binding protein
LIDELGTCRYLDTATNILFIRPPGTGKTHYAEVRIMPMLPLAALCHRLIRPSRSA